MSDASSINPSTPESVPHPMQPASSVSPSTRVSVPNPIQSTSSSSAALTVAILWAVLAVIFAIVLLAGAKDATYGGDAYTGIQNAVMLAVRGIAFLLFGSGALGIIIATRRNRN